MKKCSMENLSQQVIIVQRHYLGIVETQQAELITVQTLQKHSTTCYDVLSFGQLRAVVWNGVRFALNGSRYLELSSKARAKREFGPRHAEVREVTTPYTPAQPVQHTCTYICLHILLESEPLLETKPCSALRHVVRHFPLIAALSIPK